MWIRYLLPVAVGLAALIACLAPGEPEPPETISARALLTLAQRGGGVGYTFSRATSAALEAASVARPEEGAGRPELETALFEAGFRLQRLESSEHELWLVERTAERTAE